MVSFSAEELSHQLAAAREAARYARARSEPQSKDWIWLVNVLWTAVKRTKIRLNVPDTVIFEDGQPKKWLRTDDGWLCKGDLTPPGSKLFRKMPPTTDFFERERMAMFATSFGRCSAQSKGFVDEDDLQMEEPICIAEYVDGVREELTASQLQWLGAHREWRAQLKVLQARVAAKALATGVYFVVPQKKDGELGPPEPPKCQKDLEAKTSWILADTDASRVAEALAKFAEAAYSAGDMVVEIGRLAVEMAVSLDGELWFIRAGDLTVTFIDRTPFRQDAERAAKRKKIQDHVDSLATQLRRLLRLAEKRGVPFDASYAHFTSGSRVDKASLKKGFDLLGIAFDDDDAIDLLLRRISRTDDDSFSKADLFRFAFDKEYAGVPSAAAVVVVTEENDDKDADDVLRRRARKLLRSSSTSASSSQQGAASSICMDDDTETERPRSTEMAKDPLGVVPGARRKTRQALTELMDAARRRKRPATSQRKATPPKSPPKKAITATPVTETTKKTNCSFFHVEPGLVCTYRVVRGRREIGPNSSTNAHPVAQAKAAQRAEAAILHGCPHQQGNHQEGFLLVVVPDLFQTLETLETFVEPLQTTLKGYADAVLIGLPGTPHTCWPPDANLTNALHAKCIARLIAHLDETQEMVFAKRTKWRSPIVWLGIGNGGCALTHFAASFLKRPSFDEVREGLDCREATAGVVLVNGFFGHDAVGKPLKLLTKLFAEEEDRHEERVEALVELLFSGKYVKNQGREAVLRSFFSTRQDLDIGSDTTGIRALLKGALEHEDLRPDLAGLDLPLILLQSASDRFVPPRRAPEDVADSAAATETIVTFASSAADAVTSTAVYVAYLDAGHEILQERPTAVAKVLREILTTAAPNTVPSDDRQSTAFVGASTSRAGLASDLFAALKTELVLDPTNAKNVAADDDHGVQEEKQTEDGPVVVEKAEAVVVIPDTESSDERTATTTSQDDDDDDSKQRGSPREKKVRSKEERAREKRSKEIKKMRAEMTETSIKATQTEERLRMREEDLYSRAAEENFRDIERYEAGLAKAEARTSYLAGARDREDAVEIEDAMNQRRTEWRAAERRKDMQQEADAIEEASTMEQDEARAKQENDAVLQAFDDLDVAPSDRMLRVAEAAKTSMEHLLESRRRLVAALQRCRLLENTRDEFERARTKADHDARRIARTVRLMEGNANLRDALAPQPKELDELRAAHGAKLDERSRLTTLVAARTRQLAFANRVAQTVKIVVAKKEDGTLALKQRLDKFARTLREQRGEERRRKERAETKISEQHTAIKLASKRLRVIEKEVKRIKSHALAAEIAAAQDDDDESENKKKTTSRKRKEKKFVNCDVWSHGYMQRMETTVLRDSLKTEQDTLRAKLDGLRSKRDDFEATMRAANLAQKQFHSEANTVEEIYQFVDGSFKEATKLSVAEELANLEKEQDLAAEKAKEDEASEIAKIRACAADAAAGDSLAARIRHKPTAMRTDDEKKWVALDVMVNPVAYAHVTEAEAEQMKFDPAYAALVRLEDIYRIVALPCQLQLALPFLFTQAEIDAHRVLSLFTHEQGEPYFRHLDKTGKPPDFEKDDLSDLATASSSSQRRRGGVLATTKDDEQRRRYLEEQHLLDIVLRERRIGRLRATPPEERNEDENKYIAIDALLHPWLYNAREDQSMSVPSASSASGLAYGDVYDPLREAYANGATDVELGLISETPWIPHRKDGTRHDKESLLAIVEADRVSNDDVSLSSDDGSPDDVRRLLRDFYVDDAMTPTGRRDSGLMHHLQDQIATATTKQQHQEEPNRKLRLHKDGWDTWAMVHPASASVSDKPRMAKNRKIDVAHDHPAAMSTDEKPRKHEEDTESLSSKEIAMADGVIFGSLDELTKLRPSEIRNSVFFTFDGSDVTLLAEDGLHLEMRKSRTHRFQIIEEMDRRLLSMTVTIVYRGTFTARGYRVGRLAAAVYRSTQTKRDPPEPVGFAAYEQQQLNTGTTLGRIVIVHKPDRVPIKAGPYEVVLGAAAGTKYSIHVEAKAVQTAAARLKAEAGRAAKIKQDLAVAKEASADLWTSMRLAERKNVVVQALIDEADVESSRCERETQRCHQELLLDDERMELTEDQRMELFTEVRTLEVEFAHWCRLYATRSQERKDVLHGLEILRTERQAKVADVERLDKDLKWLQRHLPSATGLIFGIQPAVDCALSLQTSFEHIQTENARGQWRKLASARGIVTASMTPAQEVRRRHRTEGWKNLTLPERQFTILDEILHPDLYTWMDDSSKRPRKLNRAVRAMEQFSKGELGRIRELPFRQVTRGHETMAWKLLRQYHDDPHQLIEASKRRAMASNSDRAAATRFKHPKSWNQDEREWVSLDKVLNPDLWKGLKIRQVTNVPYQNVQTRKLNQEYLKVDDDFDEFALDEKPDAALEMMDPTERRQSIERRGSLIGSRLGSLVQVTLARRTSLQAKASRGAEDWTCNFDRDHLRRIWSAREHQPHWDIDECKARKLMERYNGDYDVYVDLETKIAAGDAARLEQHHRFAARDDVVAVPLDLDLDNRCRVLQNELDIAVNNSNPSMASNVLHGGVGQRFPTKILRLELEAELDAVLREQVYERERAHRFLLEQDQDDDDDDSSSDESDDGAVPQQKKGLSSLKTSKKKTTEQSIAKEVYLARKAVMKERRKDEATKKLERDLEHIGPRGCLACFAKECHWKASIDAAQLKERRKVLSDELIYVKMKPEAATFESYVPLSAARGGNPNFRRDDLVHELLWEDSQLDMRLKLNAIDRELHDAYATRKEYMEICSLHDYPTMMWTNNARRALEREHNRYVAATVANDIVDDALAFMFEGWYFGERESSFSVAGYVPSIKKDGFVNAGSDQVLAQTVAEKNEEKRRLEKNGPRETQLIGSPRTKQDVIEVEAQFRLTDEKLVKAGSDREKHMDFTERTLKFGLFCITLMFFRGMALVQREKASWSGAGDTLDGDEGFRNKPTEERKKMRREQTKAQERLKKLEVAMVRAKAGAERTRGRILKEREEASRKLHAKVRREKQEKDACLALQSTYRGHLGRKAARRWAIKRAEIEALQALMTAAAITMQRTYRGYTGRVAASVARMEMAEFISMIRMEEATDDEREYWRTHTYARWKRKAATLATKVIKAATSSKPIGDHHNV